MGQLIQQATCPWSLTSHKIAVKVRTSQSSRVLAIQSGQRIVLATVSLAKVTDDTVSCTTMDTTSTASISRIAFADNVTTVIIAFGGTQL